MTETLCVGTDRRETVVGILHALDGPEFNFQLSAIAEGLDKGRRYFVMVGYYDEDNTKDGSYIVPRVIVV